MIIAADIGAGFVSASQVTKSSCEYGTRIMLNTEGMGKSRSCVGSAPGAVIWRHVL